MTLSEELAWRGFVNQTTYKDPKTLDGDAISFYWGVDPSAASMQVGNLAAAMMVRHFIDHGHKAFLLLGGATGMIGDPDGKAEERDLKSLDEIAKNKAGIAAQYKSIFGGKDFTIVDNYDWFKDMNYLTFLREVGKHVPLRQMVGRDFVQSRMGEDGAGISYAEFSYSLIQAYDFLYQHETYGVDLQLCGADQWGNCIAGVDLIRRKTGHEAHIWSSPLIINKATGKKFGKSEDGAVWLDPELTSVYKFYQFWLNVDDEGVEDYIKIYTLLDKDTVDGVMHDFRARPGERLAQKTLAYEVTALVHGKERADAVKKVSETLFGAGDYKNLSAADFGLLENELPMVEAKLNETGLIEVLVSAGLASSNGEARRFLGDSAVYINGEQFSSDKTTFGPEDVINGYAVLRRGKNSQVIVKLS
ncbi:MAG: tyrS [Candidatus Saccharibacteria bacterium]|nr:tyrS [Candidatus Saccharibacteria bacterium]